MPLPLLRTDVAARVIGAWLLTSFLVFAAISPAMLLLIAFSVPFALVAGVISLWYGDRIILHPRRWTFAAILVPVVVSAVVFGFGSLFSLYLSVPAAALFLVSLHKWPLRRSAR